MRNLRVRQGLEEATPVPDSLEQAATWAAAAAEAAADMGNFHQSMYCNVGEEDEERQQATFTFVYQLACELGKSQRFASGAVRVIFAEQNDLDRCAKQWEPLQIGVELRSLPHNSSAEVGEALLGASILLVVAPTRRWLPAVAPLLAASQDVPVVLVNAECSRIVSSGLVDSEGSLIFAPYYRIISGAELEPGDEQVPMGGAGADTSAWTGVDRPLTNTFHMEHMEPPEDDLLINAAVVVRVWPRPYSVWEEDPDDPQAVDGFSLLDLNDIRAPSAKETRTMLWVSRAALAEKRNAEAAAVKARRTKDADKWSDSFN